MSKKIPATQAALAMASLGMLGATLTPVTDADIALGGSADGRFRYRAPAKGTSKPSPTKKAKRKHQRRQRRINRKGRS